MWVVGLQTLLYCITIGVALPVKEKGTTGMLTCFDECNAKGLSADLCTCTSVSKRSCFVRCLERDRPMSQCKRICPFHGRKRSANLDSLKDRSTGNFKTMNVDSSRLLPGLRNQASWNLNIPQVENPQNQYANSDDVNEFVYPIDERPIGQYWKQNMHTNRYFDREGDAMKQALLSLLQEDYI